MFTLIGLAVSARGRLGDRIQDALALFTSRWVCASRREASHSPDDGVTNATECAISISDGSGNGVTCIVTSGLYVLVVTFDAIFLSFSFTSFTNLEYDNI